MSKKRVRRSNSVNVVRDATGVIRFRKKGKTDCESQSVGQMGNELKVSRADGACRLNRLACSNTFLTLDYSPFVVERYCTTREKEKNGGN